MLGRARPVRLVQFWRVTTGLGWAARGQFRLGRLVQTRSVQARPSWAVDAWIAAAGLGKAMAWPSGLGVACWG
jgi:hypothetical protein